MERLLALLCNIFDHDSATLLLTVQELEFYKVATITFIVMLEVPEPVTRASKHG